MRSDHRGKGFMLPYRTAQQPAEQLHIVTTQALFIASGFVYSGDIGTRHTPLVDTLQCQLACAMAGTLGRCNAELFTHPIAFNKFTISMATSAASATFTFMRSSAC